MLCNTGSTVPTVLPVTPCLPRSVNTVSAILEAYAEAGGPASSGGVEEATRPTPGNKTLTPGIFKILTIPSPSLFHILHTRTGYVYQLITIYQLNANRIDLRQLQLTFTTLQLLTGNYENA